MGYVPMLVRSDEQGGLQVHCDPFATEEELRFDAYGREIPRKRLVPESTTLLAA
jgi:hypothetical protein